MNNRTHQLKHIVKEAALTAFIILFTVGCSKPEDEADLFFDDLTPNLYSQLIDTDSSMEHSISTNIISLKNSVRYQNKFLLAPHSIDSVKLKAVDSINATDYDCIDPDYYRSQKAKNLLTPFEPYLNSLNSRLA